MDKLFNSVEMLFFFLLQREQFAVFLFKKIMTSQPPVREILG